MSTKITLIYDNPSDPGAFETGYADQLALAKAIPGLYFSDYDAASQAVTSQEAAAFFPDVFELATCGVRIVFADVEETETTNHNHGGRDDHHPTLQ
jgi:hypothetical protein